MFSSVSFYYIIAFNQGATGKLIYDINCKTTVNREIDILWGIWIEELLFSKCIDVVWKRNGVEHYTLKCLKYFKTYFPVFYKWLTDRSPRDNETPLVMLLFILSWFHWNEKTNNHSNLSSFDVNTCIRRFLSGCSLGILKRFCIMFVSISHPKNFDFSKHKKIFFDYRRLNNESLCFFNRNGFILSDNEMYIRISFLILIYPYNNLSMLFVFPLIFPHFLLFLLLNITYIEIWHLQKYVLVREGIALS